MQSIAAIDIGSNAIRLVIGELDEHGDIRVVKKVREPVRLGEDVFANGTLSEKTIEKALAAFSKFKDLLKTHDVLHTKAVATSALREAKNRDTFIQQVKKDSGIQIDVIDGIQEGKYIFSAVSHRMDLNDKSALLIDIGGGSVELTLAYHGKPKHTQTFKMGTVRLLQLMNERKMKERQCKELIEELMTPVRDYLKKAMQDVHPDVAIGTGGNFECLGKLRVALLHRSSIFSMTRAELSKLSEHLLRMNSRDRIHVLRLRPDRADVVVPAAELTCAIMETAGIDLLQIPYVGLRDGILAELGSKLPSSAAAK